MSPDPRLQLLWYKARTVKIHKSSPESDRRSLIHHKSRVHIEFYKPNNGTSEYIIDKVGSHRWRLDFLAGNGVAQQPDNYNVYEGVVYPADLSTAPGVWRDPLPFLFPNLIVINFDLQTALYWAIPIMTATSDTFRRLIIQRIDDLHMLPFPFPFTAFDDCLVQHPLIGVLLLYDGIDCIPIYQQRLPLIVLRDQVKFVEQPGIPSDWDSDDLQEREEYASAFVYCSSDDAFGSGSLLEDITHGDGSEDNPFVLDV